MIRIGLCLLCFMIWSEAAFAQREDLVVSAAFDHIDVTTGFSGSTIEIFGDRRDKNTDVAVVVEGPERDVMVWRKEKMMGTWVNRYYVHFEDIPIYYNYALSNPNLPSEYPDLVVDHNIGMGAVFQRTQIEKSSAIEGDEVGVFRNFLVGQKQKHGTFPEKPAEIQFLSDHFFRVSFKIPPSVPTGEYRIYSYLIKHGKLVKTDLEVLRVEQVGLNAFLLRSARQYSFIYSVVCIILAVGAGWFASVVRVKA